MKTPQEWSNELTQFGDGLIFPPDGARRFIERIQQDALSDPMAQTTDQQELEISTSVCKAQEDEIQRRKDAVEMLSLIHI